MAGLGGFISGLFGSENKEKAKGRNVDSNNYEYGGQAGGAQAQTDAYRSQAAGAQGRQATQTGTVGINYGAANNDRLQGQQARQGQNALAGAMQQRALGGGPSVAQMQADRQMQQAMAQQAAMAGSARGAGGLAAAQRNAAFANANAAADISGQAQINAAQERRDDTNAAAAMYGAMRGGDLGAQQQAANQAQNQAGMQVQQNQFNADLRDRQAGRNDAMTMGYEGMGQQTQLAQMGARQNYEAQQSANTMGAQGINASVGGQNASMNQANAMNVLGMAQKAAGAIAGALAKGGPADRAKPYLVGEQGPELIVPRKDGYVLTNQQTRQALSGSPASTVNRLFDRGNTEARNVRLSDVMGARCSGGPVSARADGGPVDSGGAQSTWGTMPGIEPGASQWQAEQAAGQSLATDRDVADRLPGTTMGVPGFSPGIGGKGDDPLVRRDQEMISLAKAKEAEGIELSPEEERALGGAQHRQRQAKKSGRKGSPSGLSSVLWDMGSQGQRYAAAVDTSYHGGGGHYAPPQLIPIAGARANGGPIAAGGLIPLGPHRPDQAAPMLGAGSGAAPTSYEVLTSNGGVNVGASGQAMSDFATQFGRHAGSSPMAYGGAREEGGPVDGEQDTSKREKRAYSYDPSRPFGDRFVDAGPRPVDPSVAPAPAQTYTPSHKLRRMDPNSYEHSEQLAKEMGAGPDAVRQAPPWEAGTPPPDKSDGKSSAELDAAKANARDALAHAATTGAGGAAMPALAGLAHLLNALFASRGR